MRVRPVAFAALAAALLVAGAPALATPLDDEKAAGHVGEQLDGYLGVVPGAPASAQSLVNQINAERSQHYAEIARKNGTDAAAVAALAGRKLVERTPPGQYYRNAEGRWVRR